MKHIAIALTVLAALAFEAEARDDHAGAYSGYGLGIYRQVDAAVQPGPKPNAGLSMRLHPNVLGRCPKTSALNLYAHAQGSSGASFHLYLYGVLIEDGHGAYLDMDIPDARNSRTECFLAMVGNRLVSFDITVSVEADVDLQVRGRGRIWLLDPHGRVLAIDPALSYIDGTVDATIIGSVRVYTPGAYAIYALKFFGGTLTAKNLAASEDGRLLGETDGAWVEYDPLSMYLTLVASRYRRSLASATAPGVDAVLVSYE